MKRLKCVLYLVPCAWLCAGAGCSTGSSNSSSAVSAAVDEPRSDAPEMPGQQVEVPMPDSVEEARHADAVRAGSANAERLILDSLEVVRRQVPVDAVAVTKLEGELRRVRAVMPQ